MVFMREQMERSTAFRRGASGLSSFHEPSRTENHSLGGSQKIRGRLVLNFYRGGYSDARRLQFYPGLALTLLDDCRPAPAIAQP